MTDYEVMSYDVVCACAVIYLTCGFLRRGGFVFVSSLGGEMYLPCACLFYSLIRALLISPE